MISGSGPHGTALTSPNTVDQALMCL